MSVASRLLISVSGCVSFVDDVIWRASLLGLRVIEAPPASSHPAVARNCGWGALIGSPPFGAAARRGSNALVWEGLASACSLSNS